MTDRNYTVGHLTELGVVLVVPLPIKALVAIVAYNAGAAQ